MTYSHNSIKMATASVNVSATKAARSTVGNGEMVQNGSNIINNNNYSNNKYYNRRTPPMANSSAAYAYSLVSNTNNNNNIDNSLSHSNSIACSTNIQQHPLMGVEPSPPGTGGYLLSTPPSSNSSSSSSSNSSYFTSQRKLQHSGSDVGANFFNKNNNSTTNGGQFFSNNNNNNGNSIRRTNQKQQQQQQQQPQQQQHRDQNHRSTNVQARHSPAAVLGGGISVSGSASSDNGKLSGRKRRPKLHFQSPIVSAPADLGVGGNISPTHPLLPAVLTHFAGSKCFDAPAPSAVPKPPQHWMQFDIDTNNIKKSEQKTINMSGPGLKNIVDAHNKAIVLKTRSAAAAIMGLTNNYGGGSNGDMHTCAGHVVKSSKRNLLDDFDTHNLKLLLNVQS